MWGLRAAARDQRLASAGTILALAAILAVNLAIRAALIRMPLERDEGEFAYGGQLLLDGEVPYESLYAMKWPGIYVSYAAMEILFGQTAEGIHLGLLVVNSFNIVWMYLLGARIAGSWAGVSTAATYATLCLSPAVEPNSAQAEHFVLFFALPGLLVLAGTWHRPAWSRWLLAGFCMALAALMKQHGGFFAMVGFAGLGARLMVREGERSRWMWCSVTYLAGLSAPIVLMAACLKWVGAFDEFWFWTIDYASIYALHVNDLPNAKGFWGSVWKQFVPVWPIVLVAVGGLVAEAMNRRDGARGLVLALLAASAVAILPAREFRPHYFLLCWPVLALGFGCGVRALAEWGRAKTAIVPASDVAQRATFATRGALLAPLMVLGVAWPFYRAADFLLSKNHVELSRTFYGLEPFTEMPAIAEYLKRKSTPDDRIAIFGSMPQLFFHAERRSATGHMYLFPLLEAHDLAPQMQQSMISEITRARPKFLVIVKDYYVMPYTRREIFEWTERYQRRHYDLMGLAVVKSPTETILKWEEDARRHDPQDGYKIVSIYGRRD